jgi:hypothetical protein
MFVVAVFTPDGCDSRSNPGSEEAACLAPSYVANEGQLNSMSATRTGPKYVGCWGWQLELKRIHPFKLVKLQPLPQGFETSEPEKQNADRVDAGVDSG